MQRCSLKFSLAKCYFPVPGGRAFNSYSDEINNLQVKDVTSDYTYNPGPLCISSSPIIGPGFSTLEKSRR